LRRVNVPLFDELHAVFDLAFLAAWMHPIKIGNQVDRTNMLFWISVTVQTPAHAKGLVMGHDFHLIHLAMACHTGDATVYVNRVVEINIVRRFVDTNPRNWISRCIARSNRLKQFAVCLYLAVAGHTGASGRNVRMS